MVTHHVSDIVPEIDRVILLRDGALFRDGSKNELLTAEVLSELFGYPITLTGDNGFLFAH